MRAKRKIQSYIFTLIMAMAASMAAPVTTEAAGTKKLQKVTLEVGGMDFTKQTYSITKGNTTVIKVVAKPVSAKKSVSYKSSNTKVAAISKKGKVTAKRKGTAKISVTVKAKNGKKKTSWLKIKVIAAEKDTPPVSSVPAAPSGPSSSCKHSWKFIGGEDVEQDPVYIVRAKEYNVCKHCGYIGSYQEVADHCITFGGYWEDVRLGPEVKRQDWLCTDHYRCVKCGKERTEQYTETGETVTVYYKNSRLNWDVVNNEMGRVRCPECGEASALEWLGRDGGKCICGRELNYTEDDIFYPWTLSKVYPDLEDEHYREVDRDGNIVVLK